MDDDPQPDYGQFAYATPLPGALAEYMILRAESAVKAPASMTDEEAATLPIAALTAWYALTDKGQLKRGETVVQGTGGVSIFALQIATALGAKVIATSGREENLARVKELGAWQVINYRIQPDWEKTALALKGGKGVDQLLDVVGGEGLNQSVQATRIGGQIQQIGFLAGQTSKLDLMPLIFRQTILRGICVGPSRSFDRMNDFLNELKIFIL